MIMDWKNMFKPDRKKVVLAAALFLVFSLYNFPTQYGLPLVFYVNGADIMRGLCVNCGEGQGPYTSYLNLVIDVLFWYMIACILLTYISKGRKG